METWSAASSNMQEQLFECSQLCILSSTSLLATAREEQAHDVLLAREMHAMLARGAKPMVMVLPVCVNRCGYRDTSQHCSAKQNKRRE